MTPGESRHAKRLIAAILKRGYVISVNDGGGFPIRRSDDAKAIFAAMGSTDEDTLLIRYNRKSDISDGAFYLIYGNAPDGSELVSDYNDNEVCNAIWNEVFK